VRQTEGVLGNRKLRTQTQVKAHPRLGEGGETPGHYVVRPSHYPDVEPSSLKRDHSVAVSTRNCLREDRQEGWTPFKEEPNCPE
jgi:hypothetical protein